MRQLKITQQITHRNEISVDRYFQEITKCQLISADEEVELAIKIREGDDMALKRLVEPNLRFVISVAKQYQNQGLAFADLINEGNVGLVKAAQKFDETRGFKFISYAVWWIRQSIIQAISEQTRVVRLPLNQVTIMNKISKAVSKLEQQLEREPSNKELSEFLDLAEDLISENRKIKNQHISLDKPLLNDGEGDMCLYDIISSDNLASPDSEMLSESVKTDLSRALAKLTVREAEIINMTFGLNNHLVHSLHEIAFVFDISSERIRQIGTSSLSKLKRLMSNKNSFHNNF